MSERDQGTQGGRRHVVLTALMVVFGLVLLLPGLCALVFMSGGFSADDSLLLMLWAICFLISAGGIWLLVKALR
jgi:hypothetical protein